MPDTEIQLKAMDVLVLMHTAIKNMQLYPPASPTITSSIEKLYIQFLDFFKKEAPFVFAESERKALLRGKLLSQKEQEAIHVASLLDILLNLGVKGIFFDKGLEKEELNTFIKLIAKRSEVIFDEGGLPDLMAKNKIIHIYLDKKVYVAMGNDQKVISQFNINDDQIANFLMNTHPELGRDSEKLKEMTKDPEWLLRTFHAGLSQLMSQKEKLSDFQFSNNLQSMLFILDKVSSTLNNKDRNKISQNIGKAIVSNDIARNLTVQNMEELFGGMLLESITGIPNMKEYLTSAADLSEKDQKPESASILERPIGSLVEDLFNENADIRIQASNALAKIIDSFSPDQQIALLKRLSGRLVEWIKLETFVTPSYKEICFHLQTLIQDFINQESFAETVPIMDVFSNINTGALKKNDKVREVSLDVLQNLASEDNINTLFKELNTNQKDKRTEAGQILAGFDEIILSKLLDFVRDITDSDERVRVIHLVLRMGHRAIPVIKNRINSSAPWYYLRNLAYILGHIGNETNTYVLQPLLLHKNDKVRMEALKSIYHTGGNQRGPLLLSVLPKADDELRFNIIEMLGKLKYANAVPNLLDILKNKSLMSKDEHIALQEKVCDALGAIGSPEAIPPLSEIAESKSFLGIGSYPVRIKYAAKRALDSIKRKQS
ncbi:MAG: HEAT repeat domain-containing protein [Deltaproteobacteria bacterium]|nr:HEAT repeat domain-containing protein [Deltaproteobacteria bacterium]